LPLGRGSVLSRHGVLPLPAPATVSCLVGVPTFDAGLDEELVTPTGAAIIATVAARFERWPGFCPERVGWGAGEKELSDRPNVLRVVLGSRVESAAPDLSTHVALETNVDDMTGELSAHVIRKVLESGALDAWATPVIMKKGRPGLTLSVLGRAQDAERLAELLLRETTTLGVRRIPLTRLERPRRTIEVGTKFGTVPVKVSAGGFGPAFAKPEFDVCAELASNHGVPVREVLEAALKAAWTELGAGGD
jgi:uncharacterized protein (TIGR00299 family) protein